MDESPLGHADRDQRVLCVLRPPGGTPVPMVKSEVLQEQQIEILIVRYIVVFGPFL